MAAASTGVAERRTIDRIPESERHGSPINQFTLWFGANLQITAVVDGALSIVFGAEALTAIIGLAIGNLLGGAVMALHSAQGPRLGLPQMISSRAQFGVKGAALPLILTVLMYLGFAATGTVLSGQAINLMFGVQTPAIATVVGILGFGYLSVQLLSHYNVAEAFGQKPFTVATFLLTIALAAGWQMTFAPYVADYSRYLPTKTPAPTTFWSTLLGSAIGAQIAMSFGVIVAALGGKFLQNQVGFMGELAGAGLAALLTYIVIVTNKLTVNCLNAYGGSMTMLTTVSAFTGQQRVSQAVRIAYIVAFVAASVAIAIFASANFLSAFKNFVLLLLAVFVPWSAINLVDYYLVSKEKVDIPALYDPAGRYGAYNWTALGCYLL
jgi:nucleobase:cation symporter-1, NCS1 family